MSTSSTLQVPSSGIKGLAHWKSDLMAGVMVFLIALPLSLAIAKASGFPPIAGVYTAIIGGIVVSFFMGAEVTIKGPAAGLIVIVLGAATELGNGFPNIGYPYALACIMVVGVLQVLFALVKMGKLADVFPTSAVHGMLAAIGIIIFSKQIHIALGVTPESTSPIPLLLEIPSSIAKMNPLVAVVGIGSFIILFFFPFIKSKILQKIPAPFLVMLFAVPLGILFQFNVDGSYEFWGTKYYLNPDYLLVSLPSNVIKEVSFLPDFSMITSFTSIKYIIMLSLIGSLESLLSSKAVDSLDPYKRKAKMDKDLFAVGIGNTLSGAIGGLPMISEIVRSSANISNGAKTRWSNFYHGVFLLLCVGLAADYLHYIPNAALAAMLMFTGYRLSSPKEFYKTFKIGNEQLLVFVTTIVVTLATDLLLGVLAGILAEMLIHVFVSKVPFKSLMKANLSIVESEQQIRVVIKGTAVFTNFLKFKKLMSKLPKDKLIVFDFSETVLIDHTFMENFHEFEEEIHRKGGQVETLGLDYHLPYSAHPLAARRIPHSEISAEVNHELTSRQKYLTKFVSEFNCSFNPRLVVNVKKFMELPYGRAHRLKSEENVVKGSRNGYDFEFSDVIFEEGKFYKQEGKITLLVITNIGVHFPTMALEEAQFIDHDPDVELKDIDFPSYPKFSDHYHLCGDDREAIERFFTPEIIAFLESQEDYNIETKGDKLLIYKEPIRLGCKEMKKTLRFVDQFVELIRKAELVEK